MPNLCLTNAYGVTMNKGSRRFDLAEGKYKIFHRRRETPAQSRAIHNLA